MSRFAKGGTMPARPLGDDEDAAILSPGRVVLIGQGSLFAATPEGAALLAKLNSATPEAADADDEAWTCGFCDRGQCARCSDPDCACCNGNPEDLTSSRAAVDGGVAAARVPSWWCAQREALAVLVSSRRRGSRTASPGGARTTAPTAGLAAVAMLSRLAAPQ